MSASKDLLRGLTAISQTKGNPKIVISTKAVYGCVGNDPSGDPVGHSPKAKMRWSPDARGARDGDPVRGACAFPYRNKQCEVLQTSSAPIEVAERSDPAAARKSSYFIPPTSCLSLVSFRPNVSAWRNPLLRRSRIQSKKSHPPGCDFFHHYSFFILHFSFLRTGPTGLFPAGPVFSYLSALLVIS